MMVNGMLAGLVAITAPCAFVDPWAAAVIGIIAGVLVIVAVGFIEKRGIDDPVGAIAVHGVCGSFGVLVRRHLRQRPLRRGLERHRPRARRPKLEGVIGIFGGDFSSASASSAPRPSAPSSIWTVIFGIAFAFFKIQNAVMKGGIRSDRGRGRSRAWTCPRWACSPTPSSSRAKERRRPSEVERRSTVLDLTTSAPGRRRPAPGVTRVAGPALAVPVRVTRPDPSSC